MSQVKLIPPSFSSSLDVVLRYRLRTRWTSCYRYRNHRVVSFEPLRVVLPQEEVVLLPSVVMPRLLLVVLLSSRELPDFVSRFGTGGGAISEEGIGIVLDRLRYPVGIVSCRYRTIIAALGVAADAALVALVMADMALPRSIDQTQPSYLVV